MAYPAGVSLCSLTTGSVTDFFGADASITATVTPVLKGTSHIVHAATGAVMIPSPQVFTADAGEGISFAVPHTDQDGWRDGAGNAYKGWYYKVELRIGAGRASGPAWTKTVAPIVGQALVDLDLVAGEQIGVPVSAPVAAVSSIAGLTGVVTEEQLSALGLGGASDPKIAGFVQDPTTFTGAAIANVVAEAGVSDDVYQAFDGYRLVSGPGIAAPGDSLTAGAGGGGTSWPGSLGEILARAYTSPGTVTNLGVGGETSATIAGRVGLGVPWLATVQGGEIPTTGAVTVTLASADGATVAPLLQGGRGVNPVQIAGVTGTLSVSSGTYSFTRSADGAAVAVPNPEPVSTQAQRDRQGDLFVMWWGQNDGTNDASTIIARQRATISRLRAFQKRWIVLGLSSGSASGRAAMEAQFAAEYGDRFLNIRAYLSSTAALEKEGITPTQADTDAIAAGSVPPSLLSDSVHLNAAGYRRVGRAVYEKIKSLGWNDQWGALGDDSDIRIAATYFVDDFERVSANIVGTNTPVGGRTWAILSGGNATVPIDAGALSIVLNGDSEAIPYVNAGVTDGVLEATMRTAGGGNPSLVFRLADVQNYLRLQGVSGTWQMNHRNAGVTNAIASGLGPVADGDTFRITLEGTACTVEKNGAQIWSGAVPTISGGTRYGIQTYASGVNQRWESIQLTESV